MFKKSLAMLVPGLLMGMICIQSALPRTHAEPSFQSSGFISAGAVMDEWTSTGPEGGPVGAIAIDPSNPEVIYAGATIQYAASGGGGVYKSLNGGATWRAICNGLGGYSPTSLVIDPSNSSTIYAGVERGGPPFLKSTDGGENWSNSSGGLVPVFIKSLAIDASNPSTLYVACGPWGIHKSVNGGATWNAANTGLPSGIWGLQGFYLGVACDPKNGNVVYAASDAGNFKSTNGGASWSAASTGINYRGSETHLAIDPSNTSTIYAAGWGVCKSTNGGDSWRSVNDGLGNLNILSLAIVPATPNVLYAGTYGDAGAAIFKSTDWGESWAAVGLVGSVAHALAASSSGTVYAGIDNGICKTVNDGATWNVTNSGLCNSDVRGLAIDQSNTSIIYAGSFYGGVYKSTDRGASWSARNQGLTASSIQSLAIDPSNTQTIFASSSRGFCKSTDGGDNWSILNTDPPYHVVHAIAIDPSNPSFIYLGAGDGVFKSTDAGTSWSQINKGITVPGESFLTVNTLAIDPSNTSTIYAGNSYGGVFKSTNGGSQWRAMNNGLATPSYPQDSMDATVIVIDPVNSSVLYAGVAASYKQGIFKSTDGGESWTLMRSVSESCQALAINPLKHNTVYAGFLFDGIFKSTDGGANWLPTNTGLTIMSVQAIAIDPGSPQMVYAGTAGGGVFRREFNETVAMPEITGAEVHGKQLYVYGKNFDNGAALMMNGEKQKKTFNDEVTPATMLVAGKSGRNIAPGETVTLQVRNSDGSMSNQFSFTRPVQ
jgi:photosystem II stability/assembly factor-like uncharacterized protein